MKSTSFPCVSVCCATLLLATAVRATPPGQYRLDLSPRMLLRTSVAPFADFSGLVDEQREIGDPPAGIPANGWKINSSHNKEFPFSAVIDLGATVPLATCWLYDMNGSGKLKLEVGEEGAWREAAAYDCGQYKAWKALPLDLETRYLRVTLLEPGAVFSELALDAYSPAGWAAVQTAKAAAAAKETERLAALQRGREEALKRPLVDLPPFGKLSLVDEVDCGAADPSHGLRADPAAAVRVETILGRKCRVIASTPKEGAYFTVRLGAQKLLRAGAAYVLVVDYPEDAPRSLVVINTGNETSRGFHTGRALGDALHSKYVNNNVESLDLPLSGQWETWTLLFRLHDRFPENGLVRGSDRPRTLNPEDGFDVTIAQFSDGNDPLSKNAAVGRIRLFEVLDPAQLTLKVNYPPEGLPRRRLFWREEMADGLIGGKNPADRGIDVPLDWYRHKAELMRFLGMNTYTKDLLEFGACQGWDSTAGGGNKWVYFNFEMKDLWSQIVGLMGEYGFDILPYYEYSGSKGQEGLGPQRRAKPLTRDDGFTHIKWIESANADITDPDTLADFQKMLDLTVVNLKDKAHFAGIWLRPRSQIPVGFGDATRARFAKEANGGTAVTRDQLKADEALYGRYIAWWNTKRRDFLTSMRDYLRAKGVPDALVLFTGCPSEPGVGFADWEPRFVTDTPALWQPILADEAHKPANDRVWQILTPAQVATQDLYLKGLLAPGLDWGGWENRHARPSDDPQTYKTVDGVLLTHAFNRLYTVNSPKTLEAFRGPAGLALVRHYTLNENMMFDTADKPKLGYFVADMERAGPFCMQAEAVALANGDPTLIGYLVGSNFGRGFPSVVRDFNANFLALPALPSLRLDGASSDPDVVVRTIATPKDGLYVAVVNTAATAKRGVTVALKATGTLKALADGARVAAQGSSVVLDLRPYQLVSLKLEQ